MSNTQEILKNITIRDDNIKRALKDRQLLKDIRGGAEAILRNKEKNMPKYPHESIEDYKTRINGASLFNILDKNIKDSSDKIMRRRFRFDAVNDKDEEFISGLRANFNGNGRTIDDFLKSLITDSLWYSQVHVFIDYSTYQTSDNKRKGVHIVSVIDIENILDYEYLYNELIYLRLYVIKEDRDANRKKIKRCYIKEFEKIDGKVVWNEYVSKQPIGNNFNIEHTEFEVNKTNQPFDLSYIPLISYYTDTAEVRFNPDLRFRDVAKLQLEHFQIRSEQRFLQAITSNPKLIIRGMPVDGEHSEDGINESEAINRGSNVALALNESGGANWLDAPQSGSETYEKTLQSTERRIQNMINTKLVIRGNITATEVEVSENSSNASLSSLASSFKATLADAIIKTIMDWENLDIKYETSINTDLGFDIDSANGIGMLNEALREKSISKQVYFEEMKRRGVIDEKYDYDDIKKQILSEKEVFPQDTFETFGNY